MEAKSATEMVQQAKQQIDNLTPEQVQQELQNGSATLIDIREGNELKESGRIAGSVHAPRGMLEFYADSGLPYHKPELSKDRRLILHCASGGRSALATATLKQMGFENVAHLEGGMKAWKEAGLPSEDA
ncbi:rhodanese-like domain-containing protein [Kaistella faecalis]|uniref:rhodanese-like domain-containing protein n=1 Tax=Kaistella faecalis TaxID=2852098 RepID=UPI001C47F7D2|nr:rhodanese-like domain-containing protein [Chryseobacterium faecale]UFK98619.1 rhodanese-like domain-containing protein [Chryseobacterium faecale]